jgi:hypothetical protein
MRYRSVPGRGWSRAVVSGAGWSCLIKREGANKKANGNQTDCLRLKLQIGILDSKAGGSTLYHGYFGCVEN